VKSVATIPVAVKLSPFFSNMANMAKKLDAAEPTTRHVQPVLSADIDLETLEVNPTSSSARPSSATPMRWIAILNGRVKADLAATGGIHWGRDVIKVIMAGASVAQVCSSL